MRHAASLSASTKLCRVGRRLAESNAQAAVFWQYDSVWSRGKTGGAGEKSCAATATATATATRNERRAVLERVRQSGRSAVDLRTVA